MLALQPLGHSQAAGKDQSRVRSRQRSGVGACVGSGGATVPLRCCASGQGTQLCWLSSLLGGQSGSTWGRRGHV